MKLRSLLRPFQWLVGKLLMPFRALVRFLLRTLLPIHGKRIFFKTSVYYELSKESYPGKKALERLNRELKLADDPNALELPARLHRLFWQGRMDTVLNTIDLSKLIDEQDPREMDMFASILVNTTPAWLRYCRRSDMISDVKEIVERARMGNLERRSLPKTA